MRVLLLGIAAVVLLSTLGCADPPLEDVTIVHVGEDEETGSPDQYTIVEFPDGSRRMRYRHFGSVGDKFRAMKWEDSWR